MAFRIVAVTAIILGLGLFGCGAASNTPPKGVLDDVAPDHTLSALDFIAEFYKDEAAATSKYKGKVVQLHGWNEGLDQDPGPPLKNKNVWISSQCFDDRCEFNFTNETFGKDAEKHERLSFMAAKGRFTGRSSKGFAFADSVVVKGVNRETMPVEATGDADEVRKAINSDDRLVRSKFYGRKITVTGPAVAEGELNGKNYVVLGKTRMSIELRCYLTGSELEKAKAALPENGLLTITGWLHNCDGIEFGHRSMDQCVVGAK